ncbi:TVP38/TMEM64 family protein [Puniceicoccus vermicola]|uniref:TVP38/TMEM64 family membrane protein n=1 Tax=Puniceicoccus vermicola TaxID=388746 RepID=A0A7X1E3J8_9BACT|nr:VTT domain-containing protein [Puniceicoccus vermicola]MBC2601053.1 VTT domain-containing protein [Puniceicoccus vermicola]
MLEDSGAESNRYAMLIRIVIFGAFFGASLFLIAKHGLDWVEHLSPGYFLIAMIVLPTVGAPISLFYLAAGGLFPPLPAILIGLIALLGNTTLGYGIGRWALGEMTRTQLLKRWPKIFSPSRLNGIRAVILIRSVPGVPFWIQNVGLGAAKLPFLPYLALSVTIQGTFLTAMVLSVSGLLEQNHAYLLLGLLALIGAFALSRYFLSWARQQENQEDPAS